MHLDASDKRLILIALLVIIASSVFVWANYHAAFPQASINLKLSRDEITDRAQQFLRTRRLDTKGFRNLTLFDPEEQARLYLERELGLERANQLMEKEVPVWRWRARWFKPPEKEEMLVYLRPDGTLTGFEHRIPETEPGRRLDKTSARLLAEAFLQGQSMKPHRLVAEQTENRPNRDDHVFTFEEENFKAKEATLRRTVVLHGDKIGSYQEFLYVPEQWQRDFAKLRSSNELYAAIAQGLYVLLALAALVAFGASLRRGEIVWKPLIWIAATVAIVNLLNEFNTLSFAIDGMPTSSPYRESVLLSLLQGIGSATGVYLYVLGPLLAGVGLYHRMFPGTLRLPIAFRSRGIGTRSFFRAVIAGFGMAGAHLAFLTAFYLVGARFGVWSPQDIAYSDMLATPMPWVYPIAIAMMASSAEEFWFRLLAIPLLARFLRVRWLCIVIPALVWGFLHANYPQQPGYIRGVEVGLIGVAAGYMMIRFGIVATLVWHYAIDAFLIGMFLFQGGNWTYVVNGAVVAAFILAPLLAAVVLYRRNGGFLPEPEPEPFNANEPKQAEPEPLLPPANPPFPARVLWIAAGLVAIVLPFVRPIIYGDFIRAPLSRETAERRAAEFLKQKGVNSSQWRVVSDFTENLRALDVEYLRQQAGSATNSIIQRHLITGVWRVRFFQPLNPEEWLIYFKDDGQPYRYDHVLDEKAKGAAPSQEEALQLAERYLGKSPGKLVDSQQDKRENRTDHSFVWEDPAVQVGEAKLRTSITMIGDEACEYRTYFKIPEQWTREYLKPRLVSFLPPSFIGVIVVPLVIALVRRIASHSHRFHWRAYAMVAIVGLICELIDTANSVPAWLQGYDTSTPLNTYYGQLALSLTSGGLMTIASLFLSALALDVFLQLATGMRALPKPSLPRAIAASVLLIGMSQIPGWIHDQMPGPRMNLRLMELPSLDTMFPALHIVSNGVAMSLLVTMVAGAVILGGLALLNFRGLQLMLLTILTLSVVQNSLLLSQVPFALASTVVTLTLLIILVLACGTDLFAVGLAIFWTLALPQAWRLWTQSPSEIHQNGLGVLILVLAVSIAVYTYGRRHLCEPSSS